jgi:hypothetical protein
MQREDGRSGNSDKYGSSSGGGSSIDSGHGDERGVKEFQRAARAKPEVMRIKRDVKC